MLSLFILSTLEGWPNHLFDGIEATTEGPKRFNAPNVFYLYMIFIFIGGIFCVNLFVAILSLNFH